MIKNTFWSKKKVFKFLGQLSSFRGTATYSNKLLRLFHRFISDIFLWTCCSNAMEWLLRNSCKKSAGDLLHIRAGSIPDSLPNITTTNCLICQPLPFKNVTRTTLLLWYARVVFAFLQFPIWWLTACCPTSFLQWALLVLSVGLAGLLPHRRAGFSWLALRELHSHFSGAE